MGHLVSSGSARLGSVGALLLGLGAAFACTVEDNLPIGDWVGAGASAAAGSSAGEDGSGGSGTGGNGSGGSGTGGSIAGGSSSAGTGAVGTAGSAALLDVGCDYVTAVNRSCSRTACHNPRSRISGLDLTPTDAAALIARLKDQPARHREIDCGNGGNFVECVPASCPSPGSALLVDSANPDASWILRKLNGTHDGCGFQMPMAPGDEGFDAERKACVEELVRAIAATEHPGCYSPTNLPDPSGSREQVGCECNGSAQLCVVGEGGHQFALICDGERWSSVEDGPCDPGVGPRCQVSGPEYTQIVRPGTQVPSPFSWCNTCECGEFGKLEQCTEDLCAERACPAGTAPGERCLGCGPTGGCAVMETGCLPTCERNQDCASGACKADGFCSLEPCF